MFRPLDKIAVKLIIIIIKLFLRICFAPFKVSGLKCIFRRCRNHRLRAVSLFFRFIKGSARASERWAEKPRDARNEGGSLSHLAPSVTRVVICVSRAFCSTDQEKRETARSLQKSALLGTASILRERCSLSKVIDFIEKTIYDKSSSINFYCKK